MKYFIAIIAALGLGFGLAACGDEKEDTAVVEDTAGADAADAEDTADAGAEAGGEGEGEGEAADAEGEE